MAKNAPKIIIAAVEALIANQTAVFMEEIKALRDEVSSLRAELAASRDRPTTCTTSDTIFADVVRDTVKSTIHDEQLKSELIIGNVDDNGKDTDFMADLCEKMDCRVKPIDLKRLGNKSTNKKRLIKASFPTAFDARAFKAKYAQIKKTTDADIPSIRVRQSRSKEEQTKLRTVIKLAQHLNKTAKESNANHSFSLRDNGEIWKYAKDDEGKWSRDADWVAPEETEEIETETDASPEPPSGNGN